MTRLARVSWLITVGVCMLVTLVLLLSGYQGYAAVAGSVGIAAAINLF